MLPLREMIVDKASIFTAITRRNALRKANGLPLLDVPSEYAQEVAIASQCDFRAAFDEHADEREVIRAQVMAEFRETNGPQFGLTMGGRWAVGQVTRKRFTAQMANKYSLDAPDQTAGKHTITYGGSTGKD
jgi:hypothetical protein